MSTTTLQPVFIAPILEAREDMSGKSAEDAVLDQMKIPAWGRVLIKWLWRASWAIVLLLGGGAAELYHLNREIGEVKVEVASFPQKFSSSLLGQANRLALKGKIDQAVSAVKLATAAIDSASQQSIPANSGYFKDAIRDINFIQSVDKTSSSIESLHVTRVQLANYRSSLRPIPPLPKLPIDKIKKTFQLVPKEGTAFTFLDMGDWIEDGSDLPTGSDFFSAPPNNKLLIRTSLQWYMNGSQTLDGMQWTNTTFIHTRIKYFGGQLDLHNVRFIGCPFEIVSDSNGDKLAEAIALEFPSFTSIQSVLSNAA